MRVKLLFATILAVLFTGILSLNSTQVSAKECDYVDEDGYCVFIVDNEDKIPSIGEMSDTGDVNGKTEENIFVDTTVQTNQADSSKFGQSNETRDKLIKEYRQEYQMIVKDSPALIGNEEAFVNARLSGLSYMDAYEKCFTYNREKAIDEITDYVSNHKGWIQTFFDSMSTDSFVETVKNFGEMIGSLFK